MSWVITAAALVVAVVAVIWAWTRSKPPPAAPEPAPPPPRTDHAAKALAFVAEQADRVARGEAPAAAPDLRTPAAIAALDALTRIGTRMDEMTNARAHIVATERDLERARVMYRSILPLASVG